MKKVTVSWEASDRKQSQRIPEEWGFRVPKRKFSAFIALTDTFSRLPLETAPADWVPGPGSELRLQLVAANTQWTLRVVIAENDSITYFNILSGRRDCYYCFRKIIYTAE